MTTIPLNSPNFTVGQKCHVVHARKGDFDVKIDRIEGNVLTCTIIAGVANYSSEDNRTPDDQIVLDLDRPFIRVVPF